jgi:hypothetical protein
MTTNRYPSSSANPPLTEAQLTDLIQTINLDTLREIFQQAGYRVETVVDPIAGTPYLRSATAGLAFEIRPGNRLAGEDQGFADVAFTAVLQVQGELPLDLVNRWNATRRFARLQLSQAFLVLCMDVTVAGGVVPNHLRAHVEIWDRLVQELITYLRDELRQLGSANGAAAPAAQAQAPTPEPAREPAAASSASTTIQ